MEAIGVNGRMTLTGGAVIISRKGAGLLNFINQGLQGDKTIPLHQITAVQFKEPGFNRGYLRLSINGRDPVGGILEATRDENAVLFDKSSLNEFQIMRDLIQEKINSPIFNSHISVADEIEKLAILRDKGLLTDEEFNAKSASFLVFDRLKISMRAY